MQAASVHFNHFFSMLVGMTIGLDMDIAGTSLTLARTMAANG